LALSLTTKQASLASIVHGGGKATRGGGHGLRLTKRLVSLVQASILGLMGTRCTVLLPRRKGNIWRVQIVWPNGAVHYFGKSVSEKDAVDWIAAHSRLTMLAEETSPPTAPRE